MNTNSRTNSKFILAPLRLSLSGQKPMSEMRGRDSQYC